METRINELELKLTRELSTIRWITIVSAILGIALKFVPAPQPPSPATNGSGNSHVQIATSPESLAESESRREYFTVGEVAEREGLSDRTIISAIEQGRIIPAPNRTGRAWQISRDYRYQPPTTADSR